MKPDFALSLSVDGISLLHRAAGGWRSVGEVSLETPDLAAELADLRQRALALEPGGLRCKVIIPNDQIRYLSTRTGMLNGDARDAMVRRALDGATPYAVDDLAYDISVSGETSHVAAVARETLSEAEAFAVEHQFNPVSFVAIPADAPFLGEPYFGASDHAATLPDAGDVEPDGIAVVVIGPARIPTPKPEAAPNPEPEPAKEAAPAPEAAPDVTPPEPEPAPEVAASAITDADADTGTDAATAPPPGQSSRPNGAVAASSVKPEPATAAEPEGPSGAAMTGFASRRNKRSGAAPALAGVQRAMPETTAPVAPSAPPPPPSAGINTDTLSAALETLKARENGADAAPAPGIAVTAPVLDIPEPVAPETTRAEDKPTPRPPEPVAGASGFASRRNHDPAPVEPPVTVATPVAPITTQTPPASVAEGMAPDDETARMTVFGARKPASPHGKPKHLGLVLTIALLLFLAAVAAWATIFSDGRIARLFLLNPDDTELAAEPEPPAPDIAAPDPVQIETPTPVEPAPAQPPVTSALAPTEPSPPAATNETTSLSDADLAVLEALRQPQPQEQAPQQIPEPALEQPPEEQTQGQPEVIDTETRYAATGIWQDAPQKPQTPSVIGLDDLYVASIDRTDMSNDAIALPLATDLNTDLPPGAVASPPAAGTTIVLDSRGLVTPTPEGTLNPDGIMVYLGRPRAVPPPTPVRFETRPIATPQDNPLARVRPRLRPENLADANERTLLGGLTRAELAKKRPRLRPRIPQPLPDPEAQSSSPQAVAEAGTPDDAHPDETVASSPRPRSTTREADRGAGAISPRSGRTVVASIAPRTVKPSVPSSATVAQHATLNNAINLRRVNLIGVYGTPASRRALVRLPSGRYKKVKVGDTIDGGRVVAIGDAELRYQKSGRSLTLKIPSG